ncbi:unnamed protein product [Prunus armeniaca]
MFVAGFQLSEGFSISFFVLLVGLLLRHCIALKKSGYVKQIKDYFANAQLEKELVKYNGSVKLATGKFTEEELEEATSNYDDSRIIATGEHGKVYKGILPYERVVAVKKFKSKESTRNKFVKDVSFLSRINHRHVVRLLGYCIDSRQQILVYDFINNDTLYKHIHEKKRRIVNTLIRVTNEDSSRNRSCASIHALLLHFQFINHTSKREFEKNTIG